MSILGFFLNSNKTILYNSNMTINRFDEWIDNKQGVK